MFICLSHFLDSLEFIFIFLSLSSFFNDFLIVFLLPIAFWKYWNFLSNLITKQMRFKRHCFFKESRFVCNLFAFHSAIYERFFLRAGNCSTDLFYPPTQFQFRSCYTCCVTQCICRSERIESVWVELRCEEFKSSAVHLTQNSCGDFYPESRHRK